MIRVCWMGAGASSMNPPRIFHPVAPQYNLGDKAEVDEGGKWQLGEIVGFDENGHTKFVKLQGGSTVDVHGSVSMRPYDPTLDPLAGVSEDQLARVDMTRIRRIVPLGGSRRRRRRNGLPRCRSVEF